RFLRGAIALAVNGIPIFNPQNNRGEVSYEIGELDQWGGHCGRGDDYHYHIAPLHLEPQVGKGNPVAFGLDGYPILGLAEADGSAPRDLDDLHGHDHGDLGYHYHAAKAYPYVLGGFRGEVVESEGQVDPQPRAQGVREAMQALRGAEITGFEGSLSEGFKLSYEVNGDNRSVGYRIEEDGTYPFEFDRGSEGRSKEVYTRRGGGGGPEGGRPPRPGGGGSEMRPPGGGGGPERADPLADALDRNRDGIIDADELADAERALRKLDLDGDGKLSREEATGRKGGGKGAKGRN
ncbi:MAG: YHYH protein, partial [Verrucomicrobiae bacterium]|nr:YHYH protein [Verrucomicrobiae bacterium]